MPFVNSKLGNGFVINAVDSSINQDHYFSNMKKHVELKLVALTGTHFDAGSDGDVHWSAEQESIYCTGSALAFLSGVLLDANDVSFSDIDTITNGASSLLEEKLVMSLSVEISQSTGTNKGSVVFSGARGPGRDIVADGITTDLDDNWTRYALGANSVGFLTGSAPAFDLDLEGIFWYISNGADIKAFRNFKLTFLQELSDGGVKNSKDLDNQNTENISSFINRGVVVKVE